MKARITRDGATVAITDSHESAMHWIGVVRAATVFMGVKPNDYQIESCSDDASHAVIVPNHSTRIGIERC